MAKNSKIGWTHHSHNFRWGCHKVTLECEHCYIGPIMRRGGREPFKGPMRTKDWTNPPKWDRAAVKAGERHRVFTCSMSDFFHEAANPWRAEAWALIKACPNLDWLVLTKRPELAYNRLPPDWAPGTRTFGSASPVVPRVRCTAGRTCVTYRQPLSSSVRNLSWHRWTSTSTSRGSTGSSTGASAAKSERAAMNIDWVRHIDRQCKSAGKQHFFKQAYANEAGMPNEGPLLDGIVVQEFPSRRFPLTVFGTDPHLEGTGCNG